MSKDLVNQTQKMMDHLNQIILTQAMLAEVNFDLDAFMNLVVKQVQSLTSATGVVVELVEGSDMVYRAAIGTVSKHVGLHLPKAASISGLCVSTHEVLISNDTENDPRVNVAACRLVKARSLVVSPLFYQGDTVGVLKIMSSEPSAFDAENVKTLQLMAGLIGSALAHQISHDTTEKLLAERTKALKQLQEAEEKLSHMANYDFLTNLPNRNLFTSRLENSTNKAKHKKSLLALLFLDIDYFKHINDNYGHDIGDALLQSFALRLLKCIRKSDIAARLGGDEFVILLENLSSANEAILVAKKIIKEMVPEFYFKNVKLKITTSIGIAFYHNEMTIDEFYKQADQALYKAKKSGRNRFKTNRHAIESVEA